MSWLINVGPTEPDNCIRNTIPVAQRCRTKATDEENCSHRQHYFEQLTSVEMLAAVYTF